MKKGERPEMEQVEEELSLLIELTIRLEDELNGLTIEKEVSK